MTFWLRHWQGKSPCHDLPWGECLNRPPGNNMQYQVQIVRKTYHQTAVKVIRIVDYEDIYHG